jgi:hypothetical protein
MVKTLAPLLVLGLLGACSTFMLPGSGSRSPAATMSSRPDGMPVPPVPHSLGIYLESMQTLVEGDPVAQAEMLQLVEQSAERAPTTTNRLRLALARAVPGHPGTNLPGAQIELGALLATSDSLLPEERALATVYLKSVEQRLVLEAETRQLRETGARLNAEEQAALTRELQAAQADNARLRRELEEAVRKLEAITSIERSIRDRENGTNQP